MVPSPRPVMARHSAAVGTRRIVTGQAGCLARLHAIPIGTIMLSEVPISSAKLRRRSPQCRVAWPIPRLEAAFPGARNQQAIGLLSAEGEMAVPSFAKAQSVPRLQTELHIPSIRPGLGLPNSWHE
jgi:hypothetical protein